MPLTLAVLEQFLPGHRNVWDDAERSHLYRITPQMPSRDYKPLYNLLRAIQQDCKELADPMCLVWDDTGGELYSTQHLALGRFLDSGDPTRAQVLFVMKQTVFEGPTTEACARLHACILCAIDTRKHSQTLVSEILEVYGREEWRRHSY